MANHKKTKMNVRLLPISQIDFQDKTIAFKIFKGYS